MQVATLSFNANPPSQQHDEEFAWCRCMYDIMHDVISEKGNINAIGKENETYIYVDEDSALPKSWLLLWICGIWIWKSMSCDEFWRRLVVGILWTDDGCVDWMGGLLSDLLCSTHMRASKQIFSGTFSIWEPEIYSPSLSKLICRRYRESIELRIWQLFTTHFSWTAYLYHNLKTTHFLSFNGTQGFGPPMACY